MYVYEEGMNYGTYLEENLCNDPLLSESVLVIGWHMAA